MNKRIILLVSMVVLANCGFAQMLPYQNPTLSAEERAEDLCGRLTLEEKAKLMRNGSPAIERLGIPMFEWWNEALHGVARNGSATVYPITMAMASSFDDEMVGRVFTAVSDEARAKNNIARRSGVVKRYQGLSMWTPNINIFRDPRWGRGQETYGEDPYLTSRMGLAVVRGLQGPADTRYRKALACAKHFAVHSGPEWNRHSFNVEDLPERDLWETYLPAFKTLVEKGRVAEVMCAYQRIDGDPCCGNNRYLVQILRNEWKFEGLVCSDCGAVGDFFLPNCHGVSKDATDASAKAVLTGTDVECGDHYAALPIAVKNGLVTEEQIDISLKRLLKARFELGDFDPDTLVEWSKIPDSVIACDANRQLALDIARESMVLLKNDGILPLTPDEDIVVVGANAVDSTMMWGNYNGFPLSTTTILKGIRQIVGDVRYVGGCGLTRNEISTAQLVRSVGDAETVIFVGGISPRLEGEEMKVSEPGFRGGDRENIELPQAQRDAIAALHEAGKRIVYVNCSGSAIGLVPEERVSNAILQAWYGGEKGGQAVAEILFGKVNPSGKLPITFYRSVEQLPDYLDYTMKGRTYRYFEGDPLYHFGYGLSYTTFQTGVPSYDATTGKVTVEVTNTGNVRGTEVVQLYLKRIDDEDGPIKSLRGFRRVDLAPGESRKVEIDMPRENFETWDSATNTMRVVGGNYYLMVGSSSRNEDLKTISVTSD